MTNQFREFTADEDVYLREAHRKCLRLTEMATHLQRKPTSVVLRLVSLGLRKQTEDNFLRSDLAFCEAMRKSGYVQRPPEVLPLDGRPRTILPEPRSGFGNSCLGD